MLIEISKNFPSYSGGMRQVSLNHDACSVYTGNTSIILRQKTVNKIQNCTVQTNACLYHTLYVG